MLDNKRDQVILGLWAHATFKRVQEGYDELARHYQISRGEARRMVHEALERVGANPHNSSALIKSWVMLHKANRKDGAHE